MRGVNFYLILMMGALWIGPAFAEEETEEKAWTGLQAGMMSEPVTVKKLYREAWENDNPDMEGLIEQMEKFQKDSPITDPDLKIIMKNGMELMKKMNFGMKDEDITKSAENIQKNPAEALSELSENIGTEASLAEVMAILSETIEPTQRLMEKVYKDKSLGEVAYPIDIDSF